MLRIERHPARTYVLMDDDRELGRLVYPKWWSSRAEILLSEGIYDVDTLGFWSRHIAAKLQDIPIMIIRFSWRGGGKIERPGRPELDLHFKTISFWKKRHSVTDAMKRERMVIRSKMTWKFMDRAHEIEKAGDPPLDPLEILMLVHAINISERRSAAAASG